MASRATAGRQKPAGRSGGRSSASPRWMPSGGTGCSFQIVASSPRRTCAASTGSSRRSGELRSLVAPGSGSRSVTVAAGGQEDRGSGRRGEVVVLEWSLHRVRRAQDRGRAACGHRVDRRLIECEPGGTRDRGIGLLAEDPFECCVPETPLGVEMRRQARGEQRGKPRSCERHRMHPDLRRGDDLLDAPQRLARRLRRRRVAGDRRPVSPLVAVRRLFELVEGDRGDDEVESGPRRLASEAVEERLDLRDDPAAGREHALEPRVDHRAVRSERDRGRELRPPGELDPLQGISDDVDRGGRQRRDELTAAAELELQRIDPGIVLDGPVLGRVDQDGDVDRGTRLQVPGAEDGVGRGGERRPLGERGLVLDAGDHLLAEPPSDHGVGDRLLTGVVDLDRDPELRMVRRRPRGLRDQTYRRLERPQLGACGGRRPEDHEEAENQMWCARATHAERQS